MPRCSEIAFGVVECSIALQGHDPIWKIGQYQAENGPVSGFGASGTVSVSREIMSPFVAAEHLFNRELEFVFQPEF